MKRLALILAATVCVFSLATRETQAIPPTVPKQPLPVNGPIPPPHQPPANPWKAFNGNTALVVVDRLNPGTPKKTVATVNLKNSLSSLYDNNVADIRNTFVAKLADKNLTGYRLYNTKVSIAPSDNAYLELAVFNSKSFALAYVVPGNQIDCRIDTGHWYAPDHSMRVRFSLELTITIDTTRGAGLTLKAANMRMTNVAVDIGSSHLFDSAAAAVKAKASFSAQNIDATKNVKGGIDLVNAQLRNYIANPLVTASYDSKASQLVLTLSPSPLAAKSTDPSAAPRLVAAGGPDLAAFSLEIVKNGPQTAAKSYLRATIKNNGPGTYVSGRTYSLQKKVGANWVTLQTGAVTNLIAGKTMTVTKLLGSTPAPGAQFRLILSPGDAVSGNNTKTITAS